jgi:glutamate carboxypeptidase
MPQNELLQQSRLLVPAMVDAVEALVGVESPTEDLAACDAIVSEAIGILAGWLPSRARAETHGGRPVWRWGPERPRVLLLGHLDTVWPVGTLARLPFANDGERLRGPGVFDMKAGVVQGWAALALTGVGDESGVGMLLTTDEETGSLASRGLIAASIAAAEAVLVLEPSADGALKTARKGTSWYTLEVAGRAAHAGLDPERGVNALVAAAETALAATRWSDASCGTSVTPTLLSAGTTANTVPAEARLTLDVRAWSSDEQARVDHAVRAWRPTVAAAAVEVYGGIDRPALEERSSTGLFATAQECAAALGLPPIEGRAVGGASDGNLTAAAGVPTLDGLGAVGDGAHADHEWASVPAMADRAALLAALITTLLARPSAQPQAPRRS